MADAVTVTLSAVLLAALAEEVAVAAGTAGTRHVGARSAAAGATVAAGRGGRGAGRAADRYGSRGGG